VEEPVWIVARPARSSERGDRFGCVPGFGPQGERVAVDFGFNRELRLQLSASSSRAVSVSATQASAAAVND